MFIVHLNISNKYILFITTSIHDMKLQLTRNRIPMITFETTTTRKNELTIDLTSMSSGVAPRLLQFPENC